MKQDRFSQTFGNAHHESRSLNEDENPDSVIIEAGNVLSMIESKAPEQWMDFGLEIAWKRSKS